MTIHCRTFLESLHRGTGKLIIIGNRTLAAIVALGSLFCLLAFGCFHLVRQPEKVFHMQAFMFNYSDFSHAEADALAASSASGRPKGNTPQDPNWDGVLAGSSLGFTLGRNIPLIGGVVGPVAGAILGYEMDSRI